MTNATITITTKNNSDARRLGERAIRVPGAVSVKHLGGKRVRVETSDQVATTEWCDASHVVASYEVDQ